MIERGRTFSLECLCVIWTIELTNISYAQNKTRSGQQVEKEKDSEDTTATKLEQSACCIRLKALFFVKTTSIGLKTKI